MLRGYRQEDPMPEPDWAKLGPELRPLIELEREAPGTWYVNVLAVFPEARRRGVGMALLAKADSLAVETGATALTLTVEDDNAPARRLYAQCGYREVAWRPFVHFREGQKAERWILMRKDR